jgi:predicted transcriptional regulator
MKTAKQELHDLLERLPDDVSMDAVEYEVRFLASVRRGLDAIERGDVISQGEVEERLKRWRESSGRARLSNP